MSRALRLARRHPDALCLGLVLVAALAFKLGFALRIAPFIAKDSQAYFLPAWDLVHSGQFELGLRRTPAYPLFLAGGLALVGDDLRGIVVLQHLLGVITAGLAYLLGRLTFARPAAVGRAVGLAAGLLTAISAPLVVYEHYLLTEVLFTFAVTAMLLGLVRAWRDGRARWWLLGGALVGAATLVKPIAQAFIPLAIAAAYATSATWKPLIGTLRWPAPTRAAVLAAALVAAGYAVAVAPWVVRNQLVHDLSTPSTFGRTLVARTASYDRGFVFADPARPEADPRRARAAEIVQEAAERGESDGTIAQRLRQELDLDPIEVNNLMRELALDAIARQPLYFVEGSLTFALRIFDGIEIRLRDHESERRDVEWVERTRPLLAHVRSDDDARAANRMLRLWQPAEWAPLPLVLLILGVGVSLAPAWRPGLLLGAMVAALILASAALNGPQERYRYPIDPAIAVLMAGGIAGPAALALAAVRGRRPADLTPDLTPRPPLRAGAGAPRAAAPPPPAAGEGAAGWGPALPGEGGRGGEVPSGAAR